MKTKAYPKILMIISLLLIFTFISVYLMYAIYSNTIKKQLDERNNQIANELSTAYSNKFMEIGDIMYSLGILGNTAKNAWSDSKVNQEEGLSVAQMLGSFVQTKEYIKDAIFIHKDSGTLITSAGTTNINVFFNRQYYNKKYSVDYWRAISVAKQNITIVPDAYYTDYSISKYTQNKCMFIIGNNLVSNDKINIILIIDTEKLLHSASEVYSSDSKVFQIFDDTGNMIVDSGGSLESDIFTLSQFEESKKGKGFAYYSVKSKYNNYTYIIHMPYANTENTKFIFLSILILSAWAALAVFVCIYVKKRLRIDEKLLKEDIRTALFCGSNLNIDVDYILCLIKKKSSVRISKCYTEVYDCLIKNNVEICGNIIDDNSAVFVMFLGKNITRDTIISILSGIETQNFSIIIGNNHNGYSTMKFAYREVLIDAFVNNTSQIVDSSKINDISFIKFPKDFLDVILSHMILNKPGKCMSYIQEVLNLYTEKNISSGKYIAILYHIFTTIIGIMSEKGADPNVLAGYEKEFCNILLDNNKDAIHKYLSFVVEDGCKMNAKQNKLDKNFIVNYINQNYMEPLYLENIAEICGTTAKYFSNYFKKTFKVNYVEYINRTRVHYAKKYLEQDKHSIQEISQMVGFNSAVTFSTAFKKYYHILPSEYRASMKK